MAERGSSFLPLFALVFAQLMPHNPARIHHDPVANCLPQQTKPAINQHQAVRPQPEPLLERCIILFGVTRPVENAQPIADDDEADGRQNEPLGAGAHPLNQTLARRLRERGHVAGLFSQFSLETTKSKTICP